MDIKGWSYFILNGAIICFVAFLASFAWFFFSTTLSYFRVVLERLFKGLIFFRKVPFGIPQN